MFRPDFRKGQRVKLLTGYIYARLWDEGTEFTIERVDGTDSLLLRTDDPKVPNIFVHTRLVWPVDLPTVDRLLEFVYQTHVIRGENEAYFDSLYEQFPEVASYVINREREEGDSDNGGSRE